MWFTVRLLAPELADASLEAAWADAALSMLDRLGARQLELDGDDAIALVERASLQVCRDDALHQLAQAGLAGFVEVEPAALTDWQSTWQPTPRPVEIGPVWLVPAGAAAPDDDFVVRLPDRRAFGTGLHPTTRLVIEAMIDRPPTGRVLDLGTGTGVLALVALCLGASHVVGTDIEPLALSAAAANATANGMSDRLTLRDTPVPAADGPFDWVLANVHAGPQQQLTDALRRVVRPRATLLLTGLTPDQAVALGADWRHRGGRVVQIVNADGWALVEIIAPG